MMDKYFKVSIFFFPPREKQLFLPLKKKKDVILSLSI